MLAGDEGSMIELCRDGRLCRLSIIGSDAQESNLARWRLSFSRERCSENDSGSGELVTVESNSEMGV